MTFDEPAGDAKAIEILESVKAIFASKGFDGASMQDLARAAGMSAGNFYRYFPSKNAIIEAIIEREICELLGQFTEVIQSPNPLSSFRYLVRSRINEEGSPIWSEIEAAAARRPEAAALLARMETKITSGLVAVFARIAELPETEAERRFTAHARLIMMMVQGVSMHCAASRGATSPGADRELGALVGRVIEHTLAEVAAAAKTHASLPIEAR